MSKIHINRQCALCKSDYKLLIDEKDYTDWKNDRGYIQDLMPYLNEGERELMISGICSSCFDDIFPEEDE